MSGAEHEAKRSKTNVSKVKALKTAVSVTSMMLMSRCAAICSQLLLASMVMHGNARGYALSKAPRVLSLTEKEPRDRALELEQIPNDSSAPAWGNWSRIHSSDIGEALAVLSIDGMPHQARSSKKSILSPAITLQK